jgi:hypothetical protein
MMLLASLGSSDDSGLGTYTLLQNSLKLVRRLFCCYIFEKIND